MQDVIEKQEEEAWISQYTRSTSRDEREERSSTKGFTVMGAPWSGPESKEEFPAINSTSSSLSAVKTPLWGPSTSGPKLPRAV